ncbi:hypothetical protein [Helicobacter cetorum]|uniref:Fe2OG dioxygenase domain-containing protein n=1 Tax=Helicobacter cetorum (strain ATCC BAA-429 / MIT 00-7128) TaxID=182217 RepID=I0EPU0_HELC0|nr:hypothetical protein [Helicobacter cetorum]AFI04959.1 hypothetical protein HCW_08520 [Helicobacter cetorum MIT 00-7128]
MQIINTQYTLNNTTFRENCKGILQKDGIMILPHFIEPQVLEQIKQEALAKEHLAYYTQNTHNIYLQKKDNNFSDSHIRNLDLMSEKGCITDNYINSDSPLRELYNSSDLKDFLAFVLEEENLYPYADKLSSINIHYAKDNQGLNWHFDNSSFAVTLLIQKPLGGGEFCFVKDVRDSKHDDMGYDLAHKIVSSTWSYQSLGQDEGTLVLFRGRDSLHKVNKTKGEVCRILCVFAYNNEPNISLSQEAMQTFYGKVG